VQPPSSFLENMLAVRIHLDDTDIESGALRAVPGSHAMGRLTTEAIQRVRDELGKVNVPVFRGDANGAAAASSACVSQSVGRSAAPSTALHLWTFEIALRPALAAV
jgi:hypothetical protein